MSHFCLLPREMLVFIIFFLLQYINPLTFNRWGFWSGVGHFACKCLPCLVLFRCMLGGSVVWRFELGTSCISLMRARTHFQSLFEYLFKILVLIKWSSGVEVWAKDILYQLILGSSKDAEWVWPSMNRKWSLFIQTPSLSMHQKW